MYYKWGQFSVKENYIYFTVSLLVLGIFVIVVLLSLKFVANYLHLS